MPSPLGHALGGLAAGWLADPPKGAWHFSWKGARHLSVGGRALAFAIAGMLPDIDLLFGAHSGPTHGLGAAMLAGGIVAVTTRQFTFALGVAVAYASHTLLDWLGTDSSAPIGIMALWPFSRAYFESGLHFFEAISRRYWLPGFWSSNLRAIARELLILVPVTIGVFALTRGRARQTLWKPRLWFVVLGALAASVPATARAQPAIAYLEAPRIYESGSLARAGANPRAAATLWSDTPSRCALRRDGLVRPSTAARA